MATLLYARWTYYLINLSPHSYALTAETAKTYNDYVENPHWRTPLGTCIFGAGPLNRTRQLDGC